MAGKLHIDYASHIAFTQTQKAPQSRLPRAYAEGYITKRNGGLIGANPHVAGTPASVAWVNGFQDYTSGFPATHVGRPLP